MDQMLDNLIKDKLNIPRYKKFIDTDLLENRNYFRLFVEIAKEHVMSYNNAEGILKPIDNIVIKIIDEKKLVNGYSFYLEEKKLNVICLYSSVIIKLYELSLRFAENQNFFPSIGIIPDYMYSGKEKTKIENGKMICKTTLEDITRRDLSFIVYYFACSMLIYHEIGHLIHGHTLLYKKKVTNFYQFLKCQMAKLI